MKQKFTITVAIFILAMSWTGCFSSNRPPGLPKLHPASVTITQGGRPVSDVSVRLIPKAESVWPVTGITDATGTAKLVTYGQFSGAPEGEYTVVLSKTTSTSQGNKPVDEYASSGVTEVYSLIDVEHVKPETSKLEITIEKKANAKTFEVGEPVRVLVDTIRPGT